MREITSHKVNGLNEALTITVIDQPGSGGANHEYRIHIPDIVIDPPGGDHGHGPICSISFQNGPIKEVGVNGISQEALLAIVADRLTCFQGGPYATADNAEALANVEKAIEILHRRTKERMERGVEGTHAK